LFPLRIGDDLRAGRSAAERSGGDEAWLDRHRWFGEACARLFEDQAAVTLYG
jgi:hypothetical protein